MALARRPDRRRAAPGRARDDAPGPVAPLPPSPRLRGGPLLPFRPRRAVGRRRKARAEGRRGRLRAAQRSSRHLQRLRRAARVPRDPLARELRRPRSRRRQRPRTLALDPWANVVGLALRLRFLVSLPDSAPSDL